jgi:hypothetical protein
VWTWARPSIKSKPSLAQGCEAATGMTVEFGGLYQEQQSSFGELIISLILACCWSS